VFTAETGVECTRARKLPEDPNLSRIPRLPAAHRQPTAPVSASCPGAALKLRVLHIASGDGWGGAERVLCLLVQGTLAEGRAEVEALLLNEGQLAERLRGHGVRIRVIPEEQHSFCGLVWAVRRWIRHGRFDVIHTHRYKEVIIAVLALVPSLRRLIVTIHGLEPWSQLTCGRRLRVWGAIFLARLYGARFIGVSGELAHRLANRLGQASVFRIPNPMPLVPPCKFIDLRARFGWNPRQPVVGFLGRLEEVKGPDTFLDVAKRVTSGECFVFIGSGSMESHLVRRVQSEGLDRHVRFLGEVSNPIRYLRQLDVLAITSRHEGLPMVLLEAAACEVSVVAFDVGGIRDVFNGSRALRLVPPGNVAEFCAAIHDILADPDETRNEVRRWAEWVRSHFGLPSVISSYLAVYRGDLKAPC